MLGYRLHRVLKLFKKTRRFNCSLCDCAECLCSRCCSSSIAAGKYKSKTNTTRLYWCLRWMQVQCLMVAVDCRWRPSKISRHNTCLVSTALEAPVGSVITRCNLWKEVSHRNMFQLFTAAFSYWLHRVLDLNKRPESSTENLCDHCLEPASGVRAPSIGAQKISNWWAKTTLGLYCSYTCFAGLTEARRFPQELFFF